MAKPSSFQNLVTNSWSKASAFITLPIAVTKVHGGGGCIVSNTGTKKTYGVRSSSYELVKHEDALNCFQKALIMCEVAGYSLKEVHLDNAGGRMHAHADVDVGQDYMARIILTNSYDGTLSLGLDAGISSGKAVVNLETADRWVHFGNKADIDKMVVGIRKALHVVTRKWIPKIEGLKAVHIHNCRISLGWLRERRLINEDVFDYAIGKDPRTGEEFFSAICEGITTYDGSPTRKRDMYRDVVKAIFQQRTYWNKETV